MQSKTEEATGFWEDAEVIASYSRAQAIEDGALIDVSETAREAGITFPVAVTRAAWEDCCEWTDSDSKAKPYGQSVQGRLWDVVSMLRYAIRSSHGGNIIHYRLSRIPRPGNGAKKLVTLKSVCGPGDTPDPVITIMLPNED
jgi:hypothetical protein